MTATFRRTLRRARAFVSALRSIFATQGISVMRAILNGDPVDLSSWVAPLRDTAAAHVSPVANGVFREVLSEWLRRRRDAASVMRPGLAIEAPEVVEFVRRQSYDFARSVNQVSQARADDMRAVFRDELAEGLSRGELHRRLSQRVDEVFRNPVRSSVIAQTEMSRAHHGGEWLAMQRTGEPMLKEWLASSDACPRCLEIDGKVVELNQAFTVNASKNPAYAVVLHPPLHPNCMCSVTYRVS